MTRPSTEGTKPAGTCMKVGEMVLAPELTGTFQDIMKTLTREQDYPDLALLGERLDTFTRLMLYSPTYLADILTAVSAIHDALTARIISFHVNAITARDGRSPPGKLCWISMGSDARQEQVVRTD